MIFERIQIEFFRHAKNLTISSKYIVLFTGSRAIVLDKDLSFISEIDRLDHVYKGYVSPDESKILLVSNGNKFYLTSLIDFTTLRFSVKKPYNENLEGRGCWSFANDAFYIAVENTYHNFSSLRKYDAVSMSYIDFLPNRFCIDFVSKVDFLRKILIVAHEKNTYRCMFIWYDETEFVYFPMDSFNDAILDIDVDEKNGIISLYGAYRYAEYDFEGHRIKRKKALLNEVTFNYGKNDSLNVQNQEGCTDKEKEQFKKPERLIQENLTFGERINAVYYSKSLQHLFIGTTKGLLVINSSENIVAAKIKIEYGVENICELSPRILLLSTWSGVMAYRISAEDISDG